MEIRVVQKHLHSLENPAGDLGESHDSGWRGLCGQGSHPMETQYSSAQATSGD